MTSITYPTRGAKRGEPVSLEPVSSIKTFKTFKASELKKGCVIELPKGAQLGARKFITHPQPASFWGVKYGVSMATLFVCPPTYSTGIEAVEVAHGGFEAAELAYFCCNQWSMGIEKYDGLIKLLAHTTAEYFEGVGHAA